MLENKNDKAITVKATLKQLSDTITSGNIPKANQIWCGADVCIDRKTPQKTEDGFYPDPRYVETEYALELSWVFFLLKDAFYAENLIDGCSKIEFFGRLANAAIRATGAKPDISCPDLCLAVAQEAETIYNEITHGEFHCLTVGLGNEIYDDRRGSENK